MQPTSHVLIGQLHHRRETISPFRAEIASAPLPVRAFTVVLARDSAYIRARNIAVVRKCEGDPGNGIADLAVAVSCGPP
jgi:hypothetical protein